MANSEQAIELSDDDENDDEVQIVGGGKINPSNEEKNNDLHTSRQHQQHRNVGITPTSHPVYRNNPHMAQPGPAPPRVFNPGMFQYNAMQASHSTMPSPMMSSPMMYPSATGNMPLRFNQHPMLTQSNYGPSPTPHHYITSTPPSRNKTPQYLLSNPKRIKTSQFDIPKLEIDEYQPHHHDRSSDEKEMYIPFSTQAKWYPPISPSPALLQLQAFKNHNTSNYTNSVPDSYTRGGPLVYKLSLLSVSEFSVQGRSCNGYGPPPSVSWMRKSIKKLSKPHGKAVFERLLDHPSNQDDTDDDTNDDNSTSKPKINIHNITQDDYTDEALEEELAKQVDGGKWRIPLGAYQSFYTFLSSNPPSRPNSSRTHLIIEGIPQHQLKIASLGHQRQAREYPTIQKLIQLGVPRGLALHLAPYQRGGVDFVLERGGKALLADEMGLGKTIQSIAAMTVYEQEWPLLVVCPSTARYHWETEFLHWIGTKSPMNQPKAIQEKFELAKQLENMEKKEEEEEKKNEVEDSKKGSNQKGHSKESDDELTETDEDDDDGLIEAELEGKDWHLINSRKRRKLRKSLDAEKSASFFSTRKYMNLLNADDVFVCNKSTHCWNENHRIIIVSYDMAIRMSKVDPTILSNFQCIIVDESHMMKNLKTRRTQTLVPVLKQASRCILLSGTPAFARPLELYPQLSVLGNPMVDGALLWEDYSEFVSKYCNGKKAIGGKNLSELHTLLVSTVMIRRKKIDILKELPKKVRHRVFVKIMDVDLQNQFRHLMGRLRKSKGTLGKLAVKHREEIESGTEEFLINDDHANNRIGFQQSSQIRKRVLDMVQVEIEESYKIGKKMMETKLRKKFDRNGYNSSDSEPDDIKELAAKQKNMHDDLMEKLGKQKEERIKELIKKEEKAFLENPKVQSDNKETQAPEIKSERKRIISEIFQLTGVAKIPVIAAKLRRWIKDPSKGKLCIFAHHLEVLDLLEEQAGIRPFLDKVKVVPGERTRYIRIDGSTDAKVRHKCILAFQNDPLVRIAFLGITAAGVAVTLTAASTVWFAELFWTPSIMLQAEDRCHRIGQTATVKCLYFIGKGSFDEVLWKLIENKFRTLGEFVEGKSQNIDVHKDGKILGVNDSDDDDGNSIEETIVSNSKSEQLDVEIDDIDITDEIRELSGEERAKLKKLAQGEDGEKDIHEKSSQKPGSSKNMAIILSDDEEAAKPKWKTSLSACMARSNLRLYKMVFLGKSYGIVLHPHEGRIVVYDRSQERLEKYGHNSKPHVGDILYCIENYTVPFGIPFKEVVSKMRSTLNKETSAELTFVENPQFTKYFTTEALPEMRAKIKKKEEMKKKKEIQIKKTLVIDSSDEDKKK